MDWYRRLRCRMIRSIMVDQGTITQEYIYIDAEEDAFFFNIFSCWRFWTQSGQYLPRVNKGKISKVLILSLISRMCIPFALHWRVEPNALKVKPFNGTLMLIRCGFSQCWIVWSNKKAYVWIVTTNHLTKWYTLTQAISWFVGIYRHFHIYTRKHTIPVYREVV